MQEREKELTSFHSDQDKYVEILAQVDRHLRTLNRYLKNLTEETNDPRIIE